MDMGKKEQQLRAMREQRAAKASAPIKVKAKAIGKIVRKAAKKAGRGR